MYTIISGTNRPGSNTLKVAKEYQKFFKEFQVDANLFSLEDLNSLYKDRMFCQLEKELLIPTQKFIFIIPEYNGSFPGVFKLMIDNSDIRQCWHSKKVMLVGIADGRAGNLRGLDVLTNMCHYMKMSVYYDKLPISRINIELIDEQFVNAITIQVVKNQISGFIQY
ncbi:MAG TPA: NAD(P)H-dependent oxidoreductase [Chitinophagaceae bacterium]|nr:NAD(P)H-dependent oxidoreductase [Chitinophagaceae bacterium]